ncbi:glycine--tRNA ligase [Halosegnis rubeus]|uniref:glycine--tRNA ligase n=1 Tax=Halosegnis rubeus TaxID=2212850 RepID=A0A5N5UCH6_9EURY|nr:glycine--tRNA ligase [Halosegnis rubeus]KAB7515249.1 glycine--tRNA ligase [Halosegnis rubeus]KAB7516303.1 glycine--tRNA ligase [Halosegnis rubeus]KAB7517709.1 glycine--tRNA ligase [Halosegnis rubeus]
MSELETVAELAKRRGFFFQTAESYGGVGGFFTYGPQGSALKRNVEDRWRDRFVTRAGNMEVSAPDVMPEPVFEASGHLDGFDDMIVECPECDASHRADHLVEDNSEYEDAEALGIERVADLLGELDIACPDCCTPLAGESVEEFNLMFGTDIGPGSSQPGYLRPETAQGIFTEFPRLKEYARGQLPFGVAQIGDAYRNEIAPRRGLIRVRAFTQAELEQFIDPAEDEPDIESVADVELPLYSATAQEGDGKQETYTVREAVEEGVIESEWIAYYLGLARDWYDAIGIDMDRFRYRQHKAGERAHYAADCWDAETELDGEWVEVTGFAYRSDYDLTNHAEATGDTFTVFKQYDEPKTVERPSVDPDMATLGPEFGGQAGAVADALDALAAAGPDAFDGETVAVEVDGESVEVDADVANFEVETVTEAGEHITPHVVEPSFGIGRLFYSVLVHSYETDEVDGEERTYLSLPAELAPTFACVVPLVSNEPAIVEQAERAREQLREAGLAVAYDESGAIGRRYRRQDEIGTPVCVTVDHETIEKEPTSVTVRDRDTTAQARIPVEELQECLLALRAGTDFADLLERDTVTPL